MNQRRELELSMFATDNRALIQIVTEIRSKMEDPMSFKLIEYVQNRYANQHSVISAENTLTNSEIQYVLELIMEEAEMFGIDQNDIDLFEENS